MAVDPHHLARHLVRTVRVGINATWIAVAGLAAYLIFSSDPDLNRGLFIAVLVAAVAGAIVIGLLPWERLLETRAGMPALYVWSVLDIVLITLLLEAAGANRPIVFVMYALTTVFFAASYPRRAQILLLLFTLGCYLLGVYLGDWHVQTAGVILRFAILVALAYIVSFLSHELLVQNTRLEQKIAENERTSTQLGEAQRLARLGSWTWWPGSGAFAASEELDLIYGLDEPATNPSFLLELSHPEDRDSVKHALDKAANEGSSFIFEHRVVRADGAERTVLAQGRVESEGDQRVVIGTALDVTERKRAAAYDAKLRELEVKRTQALQINDDLVQGLTVANYALEMERLDMARSAIASTLEAAQGIVAELLEQAGAVEPGALVRSEPAVVKAEKSA